MEESRENCHLHLEMNCDDDYFIGKWHPEDDEFLKEILLQPPSFSSESGRDHHSFNASFTVQNNTVAVSAADGGVLSSEGLVQKHESNSFNSIVSSKLGSKSKSPRCSSSPKTYILSFDNSTVTPAAPEPCFNNDKSLGLQGRRSCDSSLPSERTMETQSPEPRTRPNQVAKKARNTFHTIEHIMAERKRRRELAERFIALSAMIPGLRKTDKASVLRAAIDYVKQLTERIQELEKQDKKRRVETVTDIKKLDTMSNETSYDDCSNILPKIDTRVLGKDVLIDIHCEKEKGIELKIFDHLKNLKLCVVNSSSVLSFGNSALSITIIVQMGDAYEMKVNDLVKSLRQVLLNSHMVGVSDPS